MSWGKVYLADNLPVLQQFPSESVNMIYIDPPFNTGKQQSRVTLSTEQSEVGDRTGFQGKRYATTTLNKQSYSDVHTNYIEFLRLRLIEAHRILASNGSLYFHINWRESAYCKILLDEIFGRKSFLNELIWAYDYGARTKKKWPAKHDTIYLYVKNPNDYVFNAEAVDRIPYMSPGLVGLEKTARGKLPTDVWWHTIVPTNGSEKTGYPNQKPEGILRRMILASSHSDDLILDFFAGSGTTGKVAADLKRNFVLIDDNPQAVDIIEQRIDLRPGFTFTILR